MVRIYKQDGSFDHYDESEVQVITISADNILKMENYKNGVNMYFKDGSVKFIDNAETDGYNFSIDYSNE